MRKFMLMALFSMFCQFILAQQIEQRPIKADSTFKTFNDAKQGLILAPHTYSQNVAGVIKFHPVFYNRRNKRYYAIIACSNGYVKQQLQMKALPAAHNRPGWRS